MSGFFLSNNMNLHKYGNEIMTKTNFCYEYLKDNSFLEIRPA